MDLKTFLLVFSDDSMCVAYAHSIHAKMCFVKIQEYGENDLETLFLLSRKRGTYV
ncbi:hypothetical protein SDC9_201854 [bioreactor metagenome]|uniref:Uncharacterized protein n=1 Tax=bioreactor metagenome TaxID=1076179 RepID=A0A645IS18_9ZZZZ